jgi:hypothetical protein
MFGYQNDIQKTLFKRGQSDKRANQETPNWVAYIRYNQNLSKSARPTRSKGYVRYSEENVDIVVNIKFYAGKSLLFIFLN